jgi:predicted transcriptional regulator
LYNRLHQDRVFDNYTRGQIHGYIKAKPGEHYNAIKSALELKNGILAHHLRILEKEGYVYSKRDGFHTCFYPKGMKVPESVAPKLNKIQKNIVEIIRNQPGITQHEIVPLLNASQPDVSYNITKLSRDGIINVEQKGRENKYYLNPELQDFSQNEDEKLKKY